MQYTVNRQTVFGELMHLTDYPHLVEGRSVQRVPIVLTGNDFTRLYTPLVRTGRMVSFRWLPTSEEKANIVSRIFPGLSQKECQSLVNFFADEPVAFYAYLRSVLIDDELYRQIHKLGVKKCMNNIAAGVFDPSLYISVDYQKLVSTGEALIISGQLQDHLATVRST